MRAMGRLKPQAKVDSMWSLVGLPLAALMGTVWLSGSGGWPSGGDVGQAEFWRQIAMDFGPLSPLAMSPFFGMAVLSGLAQASQTAWGQTWLAEQTLFATSPLLRHPATFWIFLALTLVSSLPRLTKVTKPVAQALDWLESYSVLVIALVLFVVGLLDRGGLADGPADSVAAVQQAGLFSLTWSALLLVAMVINYMVVQSVRFLFELMVWLSPFPFVDAAFEVSNKLVVLLLLMVYAFSPLAALALNVVIFAGCVVVLRWAWRRMAYYWHLWVEPWWRWLFPSYRAFDGHNLWVYAEQDFGPFRRFDRLHLYRWQDHWMLIRYDWFWRRATYEFTHDDLPFVEAAQGKVRVVLQQQVPLRLVTHRGYVRDLERIAQGLGLMTRQRLDARSARLIQAADAGG